MGMFSFWTKKESYLKCDHGDLEYAYFKRYTKKYNLNVSARKIVDESIYILEQERSLLLDRVFHMIKDYIPEDKKIEAYRAVFTRPYDRLIIYELDFEEYWKTFADEQILSDLGDPDDIRRRILEG